MNLPNEELRHIDRRYLENLVESLNLDAHSRGCAIVVVFGQETDSMWITQRKIHRGRTGLRKADEEWKGEMMFDDEIE